MNTEKKEEWLRRYLDGELTESEEQKALHMIADDPEMREMLRFERTLFQAFSSEPNPESFTVPAGFSDSVMDLLPEKAEKNTERDKKPGVLRLIRPVSVNPILAAAAVLLLSFGFSFLINWPAETDESFAAAEIETSTQVVSETGSEIWIRFVYFDEDAESIEVAGDFSEWDPVALSREIVGGQQVWTGLIPVTRGEHRYMFVRDGEEWITDPLASVQRDDGFGNKNAVLYL